MNQALSIKPSSVDLVCWIFIVAMILVVFVPRLYGDQKHIGRVVVKSITSKQAANSESTRARQTGQMQPKPDAISGKILAESTGAKAPPSLRKKYPASTLGKGSSSVKGNKAERLFHLIIIRAANRYQVDSALIKAIIMVESSYNPRAISKRGAKGLMQLMPRAAKALGVRDSFNPEQNINAGVRHFKDLLNQFNGDIKLALAAYNAGSRKVREYQGVPPFKATHYYIKKVFEYYRYYREKASF